MVLASIMMTTNLIFTSGKGENLYWHIQIRVQILLECLPSFYYTVVIVIFKETGCTFVLKNEFKKNFHTWPTVTVSLGHRLACDVCQVTLGIIPQWKQKSYRGSMGFFLRRLHDNKNKDKILSLDTESFYYATKQKLNWRRPCCIIIIKPLTIILIWILRNARNLLKFLIL